MAMLLSFEQLAQAQPFTMNKADIKILATNWGFPGTLEQYIRKVKEEGYDGIEMWWPDDKKTQEELRGLLQQHQLQVGFLYGSGEADPAKNLEQFKKILNTAAVFPQQPLYINCHSGRDFFSFEESNRFIEFTTKLSKDSGIRIYHETHRGRILFAAHVTKRFIEQHPSLRITLDISHWCNVHESMLHDQAETVNLALQRTDHIHARVGHPEGPQVSDPRAPEWNEIVKTHLAWWDKVVEMKAAASQPLTFLTEFGPPDYMPTLPYTRQPLADLWSINVHMMHLLRKRYSS